MRAASVQAGKEQQASRREVERVAGDLERARPRAIADEAGEEAADAAVILEQPRGVPQRIAAGQPAGALQPSDARAEEAGGEKQDQQRRDAEEALHAEAAAALEHQPAEHDGAD